MIAPTMQNPAGLLQQQSDAIWPCIVDYSSIVSIWRLRASRRATSSTSRAQQGSTAILRDVCYTARTSLGALWIRRRYQHQRCMSRG